MQIYRNCQKYQLGEDIDSGWTHISPTLQLHLYTSRNLRETKDSWLWWWVAYTKYSVPLWPKPSLMLWIWTGAKPKKITQLHWDGLLGHWDLRCDSLRLGLQYSYDTKITQLTDLMTLSTKETLFYMYSLVILSAYIQAIFGTLSVGIKLHNLAKTCYLLINIKGWQIKFQYFLIADFCAHIFLHSDSISFILL